MTNENPRGLPVVQRWHATGDYAYPAEEADDGEFVSYEDYAALLAERDAAERIGLELQGRAQRAESLLRESRRWLGDGVNSDGLAREHWTPAYASIIDRIDAAISAMEGRE